MVRNESEESLFHIFCVIPRMQSAIFICLIVLYGPQCLAGITPITYYPRKMVHHLTLLSMCVSGYINTFQVDGWVNQASRSPDITPCDFYLLGFTKRMFTRRNLAY